ncbi:MAG: PilZ domain-containing protein [Candidatus Omnitrophica bacterium]|nr:PilZ domain-containing protein [Candidatus Omnitrophota bacterium]
MNRELNKRKNKRLNCEVPVESKEGAIFDASSVVDISQGGLGFVSARRIPVNKRIPIEIDLKEDDDSVLVIGRVLYSKLISGSSNYRIGVTFENVMRGSKVRLQQYFHK